MTQMQTIRLTVGVNMPKKYILTKSYISKDHLNRLIKQITDNVKDDRQESLNLLDEAKNRLSSTETIAEYTEALKATVTVLKQVQDVNQTLLKAMGIIQTFVAKSSNVKKADATSLFDGLSKLTGASNDNEEEED
jgi:coproporphyrinogen III oxidase-like Fe-S oxidoreductase